MVISDVERAWLGWHRARLFASRRALWGDGNGLAVFFGGSLVWRSFYWRAGFSGAAALCLHRRSPPEAPHPGLVTKWRFWWERAISLAVRTCRALWRRRSSSTKSLEWCLRWEIWRMTRLRWDSFKIAMAAHGANSRGAHDR